MPYKNSIRLLGILISLLIAAVMVAAFADESVVRLSEPVETTADAEIFGAPLDETVANVSLQKLVANGDEYFGKSVRTTVRIAEVCQKKGCFFIATDGGVTLRVSFKDYSFFVPTDSSGKQVTLVGELVRRDLSSEEAAHFNEDLGLAEEKLQAGDVYEIVATSVSIPKS